MVISYRFATILSLSAGLFATKASSFRIATQSMAIVLPSDKRLLLTAQVLEQKYGYD
jgi:hypothetical protein